MKDASKPIMPEHIDKVVMAEIPDEIKNACLYQIITTNNVYDPCCQTNLNSPCIGHGTQRHFLKHSAKAQTF